MAVAVTSNIALLLDAASSSSSKPSFDVIQYESRFSELRQDLPNGEVLGYLTDADPTLTSTLAEYTLAQYALAPAVVANSLGQQNLVIANVHTPQPPVFYQSRGLEIIRDYGNGVMLLRRAAP